MILTMILIGLAASCLCVCSGIWIGIVSVQHRQILKNNTQEQDEV